MKRLGKVANFFVYTAIVLCAIFLVRAGWQFFYQTVYEKPVDRLIDSQKEISEAIVRVGEQLGELAVNINALMSLPSHDLIGMATWYGRDFEGKPMASGKPLDGSQLTAAHPSLPLGTIVKVINLNNRREVQVEITDRGPFHGKRMLDLSRAAGEALGIMRPGSIPVRITIVTLPFMIEMSSFKLSKGD